MTGIILLPWMRIFLRLLNCIPMVFMSWRHRRKGVFVGMTWNVIMPKGVGICIMPLTVAMPLLNLILLFLAVNMSS